MFGLVFQQLSAVANASALNPQLDSIGSMSAALRPDIFQRLREDANVCVV